MEQRLGRAFFLDRTPPRTSIADTRKMDTQQSKHPMVSYAMCRSRALVHPRRGACSLLDATPREGAQFIVVGCSVLVYLPLRCPVWAVLTTRIAAVRPS